ncbi:MAG: RluA family pseudouridine synthase [Alicyclobacillus herbarius]|uniref:RluA family pseudouridine synthase n=1 Tax=Alicyclobacillus herbarius TaxID=122960 RepID=UPI000423794C|nr:RluA family pseudouridine synthase [Alicyclobacillus herbarius]MCL6632876.1 RluA family pseudouridine synthase [Alicyclobacillus herbarius]
MYTLHVGPEHAGHMIKTILQRELRMSRRLQRALIKSGVVKRNGRPARLIDKAEAGDWLEVALPQEASDIAPEPMPLDIRYEDDEILVVNKPPGILAHPSAHERSGSLLAGVLAYLQPHGQVAHSVHRLDRDTSGLLMFAKTSHSHHLFDIALREGAMHRAYLAIVYRAQDDVHTDAAGESSTCLPGPWRTISLPIGPNPARPSRRLISADGQPAITHYRVVGHSGGLAVLQIHLETGRTHQIRLHCAAMGMPLVGDTDYTWDYSIRPVVRPEPVAFPRQALHAYQLTWTHPVQHTECKVQAEPPEDMRHLWAAAGGDDGLWSRVTSLPLEKPV